MKREITTSKEPGFVVSTYGEMTRFVEAFAEGHLNLLIVLGEPGLAKSQTVRSVMANACWIEGNATAFGVYSQAWNHRDQVIVLDDVDSLYSDRNAVRLLKTLCQTDPVKRVSWQTASAALDKQGIPRAFETTSRVVIIANEWKTLDKNVAAVQDRGHVIRFQPSASEVHQQVRSWFNDDEIYDWFGRHLSLVINPSMRQYVRASELKAAGLDWRSMLLQETLPATTSLVAKLKSDVRWSTESERVQEFVRLGGGCRATYFNHAKRLRGRMNADVSRESA
ncbi:hypothetical protein [Rhodopirellula bahusiensis]|uniref:AAA+ ATPase domain-containing protein n=1 Tax=Rhodopirellula bahusiensis TaxID=2014065 RepID=A0A2G1W905_9BACT|nr:hypothetical protein [Rhodopirellula bahusiensis]PHQ35119.1 hypothetical protein CEE69_11925 [Rhodopirellula bahusiensis]